MDLSSANPEIVKINFRPFTRDEGSKLMDYMPVRANSYLDTNIHHIMEDRRFGYSEKVLCSNCTEKTTCPGHFGAIPLEHPIVNPVYERQLCQVLRYICPTCEYFSAKYHSQEIDFDEMETEVIKRSNRYQCLNPEALKNNTTHHLPATTKLVSHGSAYYMVQGTGNNMKNIEIAKLYEILCKITDIQAETFGFMPGVRPENMIMFYIPVLPPRLRPNDDSFTSLASEYDTMIAINSDYDHTIRQEGKTPTPSYKYKYQTKMFETYSRVLGYGSSGKKEKDIYIKHLLTGKEGLFRKYGLAKRQNVCIRSVITPEPFTHMMDIRVPREFVDNLMKIPQISNLYSNDKIWALLNRQPTLSRFSIMAGTLNPDDRNKVISFNPLVCKPFNADFDGDESNLHVCTNKKALVEFRDVMSMKRCLKWSSSSSPTFVLVQDAMVGAYMLSRKDTWIDDHVFQSCFAFNKQESFNAFHQRLIRNHPAHLSKVRRSDTPQYPGRALLSAILPKDFSYTDKKNGITIKNGVLIDGIFTSDTFNNGVLNSMIYKYDGTDEVVNFMSNLQAAVTTWFQYQALTVSVRDCFIPSKERKVTKEKIKASIKNSIRVINNVIDRLGGIEEDDLGIKEFKMYSIMLSQKVDFVVSMDKEGDGYSGLETIIVSGAKGDIDNLIQIKHMLGQQTLSEGRPKEVLVHYRRSPDREEKPKAKGMCVNSLSDGLSPCEMFIHAIAGRESLMKMGMQTPETGYTQRLLVKYEENIRVADNGIVRHNNGTIVQLSPGNGSLDPSKIYKQNDPLNLTSLLEGLSYNEIPDKDKPAFQRENILRGKVFRDYVTFDSYGSMLEWYAQVPRGSRCLYEVIPNGPQKFRLDLECYSRDNISHVKWCVAVATLIDVTLKITGTQDYIRYESIDPAKEKKSEHVVFTEFYVESATNARKLLMDVLIVVSRIAPNVYTTVKSIVDASIYKPWQTFRIEGSTKINHGRHKYVKGCNDISDRFLDGLIRNVDTSKLKLVTPKSSIPATVDRDRCSPMYT
ncbi:DNA-directed RNA polymerase II subunit RPB1 [Gaertneriomyces sp. JEL0708]|nr:DNA-directed RNA polymerase II subunit RPB1 [Gaertneriomyces sp. JEL0708]